jgi:hypothetical protein
MDVLGGAGIYVQVGIHATLGVDDEQPRNVGTPNVVGVSFVRRQKPRVICFDEFEDIVVRP